MLLIIKKQISLVVLVIFAIGTWVISQFYDERETLKQSVVQPFENKFYLNSAKIINTDSSGDYLFTLQADYIEQESKDSTEFFNVKISYTPKSKISWTITSDKATKLSKNDFLILKGNVIAKNSVAQGQETKIYSELIELNPQKYIVKTSEHVIIQLGEHNLSAIGMQATLDKDKLTLQSKINGTFLPPTLL